MLLLLLLLLLLSSLICVLAKRGTCLMTARVCKQASYSLAVVGMRCSGIVLYYMQMLPQHAPYC
jgi:predicted MFS family arabinose efflux permease